MHTGASMTATNVVKHATAGAVRVSRAFWLGLLLWGAMFSISSTLYPLSVGNRRLFESLMAVALAGVVTCVATAYLRGLEGRILVPAIATSLMWPVTCIGLDLLVFMLK